MNFNFTPEERKTEIYKVPAGIYVGKVLKSYLVNKDGTYTLHLCCDITEGDYAQYYTKRFNADTEYKKNHLEAREVKWKGVIRFPMPDGRDPQIDASRDRKFRDCLYRFEKSNAIRWQQTGSDEQSFARDIKNFFDGKAIGLNVADDEFNGVQFTKIARVEIVDDVRNGKCRQATIKRQQTSAAAAFTDVTASEPELPF